MAKTKEDAGPKLSMTDVSLIASLALALALAGLCVWLRGRETAKRGALEASKKQYEEMKLTKQKILALQLKNPKGQLQTPDEKPADIASFISQTARKVGVPQAMLTSIQTDRDNKSGGWREYPVTVTLNGSKEQPVPRQTVVDFLATIEKERPYLKSKNLTVNYTGPDFQRVTVTVSFFKRE